MVCPPFDPAVPPAEAEPTALLARLRALEARVAALEAERLEPEPEQPETLAADPAEEAVSSGTALGLAGRTCLILGGAFLLRALTDSGTLPGPAGVAAGLAYSALWTFLANRSASKGQGPWAAFQVFAAVAIAFPLLFETTVRLKFVAPGTASAGLLVWTVVNTTVAVRHGLRRAAWITVLAALAVGFAIMAATSAIAEFSPFFILASGLSLLLSDREPWRGLRWPAALGADLAILVMVILTLNPGGSEELARDLKPGLVQASALAFVAVHLGGFLYRTLMRPRAVAAFEILQTLAVLVLGLGGAVRVAQATGGGLGVHGSAALLFGLACYACAFAFVEKQAEASLDFKYLTSLAIVLMLSGSLLVLGPRPLALVCLASGLATTWLGVRYAKFSLEFHGLLFLAAAALASGLLAGAWAAFAGPAGLHALPAPAYLTFAGLALAHLYPLGRPGGKPAGWEGHLPSLGFAALSVAALAGLAAGALPALTGDAALLAALRTGVLVILAVLCALAGRWKQASELPWLAYPLLGCAALKLLLEDLPQGRPATMFLAFTLFGVGLLAVPKLLKDQNRP